MHTSLSTGYKNYYSSLHVIRLLDKHAFYKHQARSESSVTGGGGERGGRKKIWGGSAIAFFRGTILAREARLLPGRARRNLLVRISVLARKCRSEDQKKKLLGAKSWASFWRSFVCFVLERDFTHAGGHKQYFGEVQTSKCTSVAVAGLLLSSGTQSPSFRGGGGGGGGNKQ